MKLRLSVFAGLFVAFLLLWVFVPTKTERKPNQNEVQSATPSNLALPLAPVNRKTAAPEEVAAAASS